MMGRYIFPPPSGPYAQRTGSLTRARQVTLELTAGRQQEAEDPPKPGSTK